MVKSILFAVCGTFLLSLVGSEVIDLSSSSTYQWKAALRNNSIVVDGTVPGSIYTDLDNAGGYLNGGPLLFRFNDLDYRWVSYQDWDYSLQFDVSSDVLSNRRIDLVFHGVDTIAEISLNGEVLGNTNNMFIRYRYDVKGILKESGNDLVVRFTSPVLWSKEYYDQLEQEQGYPVLPTCLDPAYQGECHANHIRKMQSSFSWDWGPAFPTMGLWLPVKIEAYGTTTIRDWWVGMERDVQLQQWNLNMKMHCETVDTNILYRGVFTVAITDPETGRVIVSRLQSAAFVSDDNKEATFALDTIPIRFSEVEQWMPNGWGSQKMYNIRIEFQEEGGVSGGYFMLEDKIAFRTVELVEEDMSVGRSYFFRVNGEPVFIKGSNWIPSTVLPELVTEDYLRKLLTSVKKANMNALRIWGGGLYEFTEFYKIADELGILIWHDMMFACSMYPATDDFLTGVAVEIRQQIRRLSRHPSVLIWAGNNENEVALRQSWYGTQSKFEVYKADYIKLYVDTIKAIVNEEDPSRPYTVSSPSNGKQSEQDGYISMNPGSSEYGDVHYYNYVGDMWNWESYPKPRMATEYGFQALPSVHAWRTAANPIGTTGSTDWDFDGELIDKRQHHPNGNPELILQVEKQLGKARTTTPEQRFLDMIYLTQMHQAEAIKIESEHYRRLQRLTFDDGLGNCMGALYWQLQDIWQGPSWASIELGGRWKPLHYFAAKFFAPLTFMLWVRDGVVSVFPSDFRDGADMVPGVLQIQLHSWSQLSPIFTQRIPNVNGDSTLEWQRPFDSWLLDNGCTRQTCFLTVTYEGLQDGQWIAPDGYLFPTNFNEVTNLAKADVKIESVGQAYASEESQWSIDITISTDKPAAFVWLDTNEDRPGRFSDNGFLMSTASRTVTFWSEVDITTQELSNDLIIQHLAQIIR